jgi:hypothetical protein
MLTRMQSSKNSRLFLVGKRNDAIAMEDSVAVSHKTKLNILLPYNPIIMILGVFPEELKT